MKIKDVIYNPAKRTVTVSYLSGATRTYRGRVPYSVCEYLMSLNYQWGFNDGATCRARSDSEDNVILSMEDVYYVK